ncbi:SWIM zinc finger family protein [Streptomyces sp. O3]
MSDAYADYEEHADHEEHDDRAEHDDRGARAEGERTFATLPPVHGRGFATSWWGRAWLKALEDTALDSQQVKTGRRLARAGAVGAVSVRPGRITAVVRDPDRATHRSDVLLQRLDADAWDRFLDMAVERAGHIAALLDHEMPPHLVEDAAAAGVELLPGIGDLEPECDCDAWDHCGHTAALCYQLAGLLDEDPFVLLLMRGRGEHELLDELRARSVARAAPDEPAADATASPDAPEGVSAEEAYALGGVLPPLPAPPALPDAPGTPPGLDTETEPAPGLDVAALAVLAADAAAAAHRLLAEALSPGHAEQPVTAEPTPEQDAVRLAAAVGGADGRTAPVIAAPVAEAITARLAAGSGRDREGLALAVRAWEYGGAAALPVLEEEWTPRGDALARARAALDTAWDGDERPRLRAARNRWTVVGAQVQLRYGRDGRWWPYRKERGRWTPAGTAAYDPATALAAAVAAGTGGA